MAARSATCKSQSYQKDTYTNVGGRRSATNTFFTEQAPHKLYIIPWQCRQPITSELGRERNFKNESL